MIPRVVVHLEIRRSGWGGREAHPGNNRREAAVTIRKCKSGDIEDRSKNVPLAGNDRAAERRIEEVPLRDAPRKDLAARKQAVRYPIFDVVRMVVQIHIIHDDRSAEPFGPIHIVIIDSRLDHMAPASKVPFELRPDEIRAVVERKPVQRAR